MQHLLSICLTEVTRDTMRDSIIKLASCWHNYYQQKHVDGKHAADILINSNLRSALEVINIDSEFDSLLTGSSSGEGNITRAMVCLF
jgi:hypothetical protein